MLSGVLSHSMRKYPQFLPTSFTITKSINDKTEIKMNSSIRSRNWRKNEKEFSGYLNRFFGRDKADLYLKFNSLQIGDGGIYSLDNYYFENPGITRLIVRGYPVFKSNPTVKAVTSNSIELTFQEWEQDKDKGTGTPNYYTVQYKKNGLENSGWEDSEEIKANSSSNNSYIVSLTNLQSDKTYIIRIIIKDISGHAQMNDAPILRASTLCGIPEEPPKHISINTTSSTKIVVNWKLPLEETWNCRNIYVNIFYNSSNGKSFRQNKTDNSFIITTEPFTEWNISLRLGNEEFFSEWSSLINVISAQDAPSSVQNLNARNVTDSRVYLTWDKPNKENGIIVKYIVRYRQEKWLHSCTSVNNSALTKDVDANETSIVIDTYPNSKYTISVSALTVKEGEEVSVNVMTKESVPGGPPQNLRHFNIEKNLVGIEWEPPVCSLSYGKIIEYQYVLDSKDPWEKRKRSGKTTQIYDYVDDLVPFTVYTARVYAGTKIGFSSSSAEIDFTTKSDKPSAPTNLTIFLSTESILSMSWIPPYPPNGVLQKYVIEYCSLESSYCRKTQKVVNTNEVKCLDDIRKSRHCYTLTDLKGNQKYKIEITAYNEHIYGGSETVTTSGETKEYVPDPPKETEIANITEHSVDIIWSLPVRSNGQLTGYRINITVAESFNNSIIGSTQEKLTNPNTRSCTFINLHPATKYNGTIEASTKIGYGKPLYFQFTTKVSVPVIDVEPTVSNVTDTTVVILIKPIHFIGGPVTAYFVMVEKQNRRKKRVVEEKKLLSYNESREDYVAAKFYPNEISSTGIDFTVGDGKHYNGYYNAPLTTGEEYKIGLAVLSEFNGEERLGYKYLTEAVTVKNSDHFTVDKSNIPGIIIGVLVCLTVIIVIIIFIRFRYPKLLKYASTMKDLDARNSKKERQSITLTMDLEECAELEPISEIQSKKVPVSELETFVQTALRNGTLRKQFTSVEKGQNKSWETAKIPENKLKNRYGNLLSYDSTRVVLEKLPDDPYSDYINANYIDGYKSPKRYIATQGPKPLTVNDFWRMIWQEKVCKIIISTNLVENGKTKCEKYWADSRGTFGSVTVTLLNSEIFADYVIRTFHVSKENEVREIKQFHFTTWPDHGVPMYAIAVSNFILKTRTYKPKDKSPIVFHCSAGIGRTGTLILIDSMLDMAAAENHVDLLSQLHIMRQQRINMVETMDQYYLACQCLIEALCTEKTSITCSEFIPTLNRLKTVDPKTGLTQFHVQFEKLSKICPLLKTTDCRSALDPTNQGKNRSDKIIPPDRSRPILKVTNGNPESSYINAVYVNGYKQKDAFLVTQIPLPETVSDFWRMAFSSKTSTIVLLNELDPIDEFTLQTCMQYWPENTETYEDVEVKKVSEEKHGDIIVRTFELRNISNQEETVTKVMKQFHLTGWSSSSTLPTSSDILLCLIEKVERWQQNSATTTVIVQCLNGARACGLYCGSVFICDKIKYEQEVDVFFAVRSIRANRPQFIEDVGQYIYCHQVALTYLDSFETYANFQ
ncbi:receptor-type tyrosine-protein phosphatase T-like isoform X3 [Centruroides sculpturatus]|uniref:receptor-type tyrosine-protein phosphatase T-like isoform X3 n=1 Tax=Centruroides sculpturatus TaxID=218467 RepID=UPI000C6E67F9|nr:receptor-type tyrosine-protein phosphatase T-like isoform X3 [Centruroides sculpturatus]